MFWRIGEIAANQYSVSVNASHTNPIHGSHRRYGASLTRSGRVKRASSALTPGRIQLRADATIVNHAEATRFSLPSRFGSALGARKPSPIHFRIEKFEKRSRITAIPSAKRIALAGAR